MKRCSAVFAPYLTKALPSITITDPFINPSGITLLALLTQRVTVVTFGTLITLLASVGWFTVTLSCFNIASYVTANHTMSFTPTLLTAKNWVVTIGTL